jgi:cytochrome P450
MRLYPPVYTIGREAIADCQIGGFHVPRGLTVITPQWLVQHDERFFSRPYDFLPERWTEEFRQTLPKFAYFPFGGGPRICIGNTFAMMEMALLLATIAQRYSFRLAPGQTIATNPSFTLQPATAMHLRVESRDVAATLLVAHRG